jgi:protein-S-isoprenylcysteine O-methyltransferase Ste14
VVWLRTALFALTFVATALLLVPRWLLGSPWAGRVDIGGWRWTGLLPLAAGLALMLRCWVDFALRGRGTPAPFDPPQALVIAGPYRYVRNPMYLAAGLVLLGQAVWYGALGLLLYGAMFWLVSHLFVIGYEEPALGRRFGTAYREYRARVPRWVPRRPRAAGSE